MKIRISGYKVLRRGMDVGEVAASAAGDPDLFADCFVAFEDGHRPAPLTRFDSAHQAGRARTDNHDVKGHTKILCLIRDGGIIQDLTEARTIHDSSLLNAG